MKTIYYLLSLLCVCIFLVGTSKAASSTNVDLNKNLRVGLKELYENVDSITIDNNSLLLGYDYNGKWTSECQISSSSGFTVKPAYNYYIMSIETYNSYEDCLSQVTVLRNQGFNAFAGSASPGIWKVYVGDVNSIDDANSLKSTVSSATGMTFDIVSDNGLRTIMTFDSSYPIIMDNSYAQVSFGTNNVVGNVQVIDLGKRSYRGKMEIGRYNEYGVTAVNVVGLEDYLYGVVPSEMSSNWPIEALKAQAVAARNFAAYNGVIGKKYVSKPYSICDTVNSQVYKGFGGEKDSCTQAVNQTYGKLIYFSDSVIPAYYFSTSGGHTEDSQNVWSGTVPYYKGVPDLYETDPELDPWVSYLSSADIQEKLNNHGVDVGIITDVSVTDYSDAGRAMSLLITGVNGTYEVPKETMRVWFGLKSRKFTLVKNGYVPNTSFNTISGDNQTGTIDYNNTYVIDGSMNTSLLCQNQDELMVMSSQNIYDLPMISGQSDTYIFVGEGFGHGVGMSQSGAKGMALAGFNYQQILEYYYSGTTVK